ncbi:MAG: glycoside hydrolase family 27 protein, partial [Planctomycetota bacterium]
VPAVPTHRRREGDRSMRQLGMDAGRLFVCRATRMSTAEFASRRDTPPSPTDKQAAGIHSELAHAAVALTPPMGWNSWDCFGVSVREEEIRANAEFLADRLLRFGWEYVVVDLAWYSPTANTENYKKYGLEQLIDPYGRLVPDPIRFPSSAGGRGFKPLADFVHSLGLKFGIHIMRGIPWQAVERNTPILHSGARAREIAQPLDGCYWFANMDGVNTTRDGGQAYYDSLAELYASWDVDFLKADDMNSWDGEGQREPYHTDEIEALRRAIDRAGRPMALSLSPGAAQICNANHLRRHANLWRISCDFWDDWAALKRQFARCRLWAPYVAPGHWPDADMLPIGRIGIRGEIGEPRDSRFNQCELTTLMTLWCIFRSPLMFGGHLPETDDFSLSLISNPEALAVNQQSNNNRELEFENDLQAIWIADASRDESTGDPLGDDKYVALFNLSDETRDVRVELARCDLAGRCRVRDLWKRQDVCVAKGKFTAALDAHAAGLYRISSTR